MQITRYRLLIFGIGFSIALFNLSLISYAQTNTNISPEVTDKKTEIEFVGEMFGFQVPLQNYYFIKSVLIVFGNKFGGQPKTPQEQEDIIWEQLMLSYESFRRNIIVGQEEISQEVEKILKAEKIDFDWQLEKEAYKKWLDDKAGESVELFENQIRHLLQIQKLRQQIMDNADVKVSEEEAFEEFLNETNSINLELIQFGQEKDAQDFYKKARANKKFWDKEKEDRPKEFRQIGRVSLEFLIDLWKISNKALYKMMKMKTGQIYPPEPIYKGYAVFKIIEKKQGDNSEFKSNQKARESCFSQVEKRKRFQALDEFYKELKKKANIKIYEKTGGVK